MFPWKSEAVSGFRVVFCIDVDFTVPLGYDYNTVTFAEKT